MSIHNDCPYLDPVFVGKFTVAFCTCDRGRGNY